MSEIVRRDREDRAPLAVHEETGRPGLWEMRVGECPVVATAIHAGHGLRPEVEPRLRLPEEKRRREEDPGTERFIDCDFSRVVVRRSRFEVDLNRPRDGAV